MMSTLCVLLLAILGDALRIQPRSVNTTTSSGFNSTTVELDFESAD